MRASAFCCTTTYRASQYMHVYHIFLINSPGKLFFLSYWVGEASIFLVGGGLLNKGGVYCSLLPYSAKFSRRI